MNFALLTNTVVNGAASSGGDAAASSSGGMNPMMIMILYIVVIFGVIYIFSIRPQKKKNAAMEQMRKEIMPGDPVLLANGMFGKVVDVTAECYIIEFGTNKGVRVPVLKQEVYAKKEPNLTNKVIEEPQPEKKGLFGFGKKKTEDNDFTKSE